MGDRSLRGQWLLAMSLVVILGAAGVAAGLYFSGSGQDRPPSATAPVVAGDVSARVHEFCGACHAYPPPDSFPRSAWKKEVERGYHFFQKANLRLTPPAIDEVIRYYET